MAMIHYTGWQWLLIDAATQYGLDKLTFEERMAWTQEHLDDLEMMSSSADTGPLYQKAVLAIRKAQQGLPTGHLVGVDGTCSGIQMMSVLTGCIAGATSTGLVNPNVRADAYSACTEAMNDILGGGLVVSRSDAKQALMTSFYGSKAQPKSLFGEETPELEAFYQAAQTIAPGAWDLLQDLLASWKPYALQHCWVLPDGFDARIKVMTKKEARIEVDELDHATFTYEFYENQGQKSGLANAANLVHSVDAYVLRSMHRRCNYDRAMVEQAAGLIEIEMISRSLSLQFPVDMASFAGKAAYYVDQYNRSDVADVVILPFLDSENISFLSQKHLESLATIVQGMLQYKPFELVTIHDEFKAHPNNINWVRYQYKEILAELADSNLLDDLLSQLHGVPGTFKKLSNNLGELIKESAYGLC
jgi:hypothetical protein